MTYQISIVKNLLYSSLLLFSIYDKISYRRKSKQVYISFDQNDNILGVFSSKKKAYKSSSIVIKKSLDPKHCWKVELHITPEGCITLEKRFKAPPSPSEIIINGFLKPKPLKIIITGDLNKGISYLKNLALTELKSKLNKVAGVYCYGWVNSSLVYCYCSSSLEANYLYTSKFGYSINSFEGARQDFLTK
jgi:hypothetical protein